MFYKAVVVAGWPLGALVGLAVLAILLAEGSSRARRRGRRRPAWLAVAGAWLTLPLSLEAWVLLYWSAERPVYPDSVLESEILLVEVLALAAANCLGVLAIWAGVGRGHWFLRMLVVVGAIALPLLIPAYGLVVMVSVQSAVTIVPLAIRFFLGTERSVGDEAGPEGERPRRRAGPRRGQFAVRDLLLGTVLVAMLLGIAVAVPGTLWGPSALRARFVPPGVTPAPAPGVFFGAWGAVFGIGALVAAWVALRRGPLWSRLPAVVPALPMVPAMLWLALWRGSSGRRRWPARVALALLSLVLLAPPAMVYYCLVTPPPVVPKPVLPEPNGYVLALEAAKALGAGVRTPAPSDRKASKTAFFAAYGTAIEQARRALDYPARVPLQFTVEDDEVTDFQHVRELARALTATADRAVQEGRLSDAVACQADVIRLGRVLEHGGLVIHRLVGMAIEGIGLHGLHPLVRTLTPEQCRTAAGVLAKVQAERESFEEVWARDEAWTAQVLGWQARLSSLLAPLTPRGAGMQRIYKTIDGRFEAKVRIVLTELAVRAYLVEQGRLPGQLADLVPAYLPAVPEDPLRGEPLVYRREGAGYRVSSPSFPDEQLWGPPPTASAKDDSAGEPAEKQDPP